MKPAGSTERIGGGVTTVFPFVVAQGRSGTTLLRAILDSHPDMAIPGESHFIVRMAKAGRYDVGDGFATDRFLADLLRHPRFRAWNLPEDEVRAAFRQASPSDLAEAFRRAYALYALDQGKPRYGDKTPGYVLHIPLIGNLFPESRFIHIIRDGRDVALSYLELEFGPKNVAEGAMFWRRAIERGRRGGRELGPHRYREVRYEDLLDRPEEVVRSLCGFVDLSFDDRMLRYFERAGEVIRPSGSPHAHQNLYLPPTKGLRDWRRQMSRADVSVFEVLAGDLLSELGYERAVERPTVPMRFGAWQRELRLQGERVVRRTKKKVRQLSRGR